MTEFNEIYKAIIPVAGLGTRMMPAAKSTPKELFPLLNKPLIQHVVEEAIKGGIKEIVFITRRGKEAIEDHFDSNFEIESLLKNSGKKSILKEFTKEILKNISFQSVRQGVPLGLGHAILSAKHVLKDGEPFAVFLPDEFLFTSDEITDFQKLIANFKSSGCGQVLVEKVKKKEISNYGIIDLDRKKISRSGSNKISNLLEKPTLEKAPSNLRVIGRYILPYEIFSFLSRIKPGKDNEIQLTDAIKEGIKSKKLTFEAVLSKSHVFNCGSLEGFLGANVKLASRDVIMKKYLKELLN